MSEVFTDVMYGVWLSPGVYFTKSRGGGAHLYHDRVTAQRLASCWGGKVMKVLMTGTIDEGDDQ